MLYEVRMRANDGNRDQQQQQQKLVNIEAHDLMITAMFVWITLKSISFTKATFDYFYDGDEL